MELELQQLDERYQCTRVQGVDRDAHLLASLAESGQRFPVVVVVDREAANRFVLIDGFKRVRCLRRLHRDTVEATVLDMTVADALVFARHGKSAEGHSALEQGWLLVVLTEQFRMSPCELATRFGRSESWVSRRLSLVRELPVEIQDHVRRGAIGAHAAMKYLVPMARTNAIDCVRLAGAVAGKKLSTREIGVIYSGWRNGRGTGRERVIENPILYLRSQQAQANPERFDTTTISEVARDVAILTATARRLERWLAEIGGAASAAAADREQLCHAAALGIITLQKLRDTLAREEGLGHAS